MRNDALISGATDRLLAAKEPYDHGTWCDIYYSILEVNQAVRLDPDYQISFITEWVDNVNAIQKSNVNNRLNIHPRLKDMRGADFDMLARSIWFPNDFRFTDDDRLILGLIEDEVAKGNLRDISAVDQ